MRPDTVFESEAAGSSSERNMSSAGELLPGDQEQTKQQEHKAKSTSMYRDRVDTAPTPKKPVAHVKPIEIHKPIPVAEFPSYVQKRRQTEALNTEYYVCFTAYTMFIQQI